jgi:TolB-like protein
MTEKKIIVCVLMTLLSAKVFPQSMTLDEAIRTTATELGQRLNGNRIPNTDFSNQSIEQTTAEIRRQLTAQTKIAVSNFKSNWERLSDYVIDELNNAIIREGSLTVVNRQQLDIVRREQNFQMSGDVSDKSAQSIGKLLGAQSVLFGSFTKTGNTYRFRIRVIAVETGVDLYSNSIDIKKDKMLSTLTPASEDQSKDPYYYGFGDKLEIGLLNMFFGAGSYLYEKDLDVVMWVSIFLEGLGALVGLPGIYLSYMDGDWAPVKVGSVIYGIGAILGIVRPFFLTIYDMNYRWDRKKIASILPINIDLVPTSSNNIGVQMIYKLSF